VSRFDDQEGERKFNESLRKARDKVYYLINRKLKRFENILVVKICECFAYRAGQRLRLNATPYGDSEEQIDALAESITVRPLDDGSCSVVIPVDQEGLFMFLEFGTGLVGEADKHEEADEVGWEYGMHRDRYVRGGWFFKRENSQRTKGESYEETHKAYVDMSDEYPVVEQRHKVYVSERGKVKGYTRKDGRYVRSYTRKRANPKVSEYDYQVVHKNSVFSRGLKPTRYIYNTKQEIYTLFDYLHSYKKGKLTMQDVLDKVEELKNSDIN